MDFFYNFSGLPFLVLYFTHLLIINKDGNVYIPVTKYGRCMTTEWSVLTATVQQQTGRKLSDPYWSKYCVSFGSDFIRLKKYPVKYEESMNTVLVQEVRTYVGPLPPFYTAQSREVKDKIHPHLEFR